MSQLFRKAEANLYIAEHKGRRFKLHREPADTRNRKWSLREVYEDAEKHDRLIAHVKTIKAGERVLSFVLMVDTHLENIGATVGGWYYWTLPTRLGPLLINPRNNAVMMRFKDVDQAKVEFGDRLGNLNHFNPYSGKWNMHWSNSTTNEEMFQSFVQQIQRVLE